MSVYRQHPGSPEMCEMLCSSLTHRCLRCLPRNIKSSYDLAEEHFSNSTELLKFQNHSTVEGSLYSSAKKALAYEAA